MRFSCEGLVRLTLICGEPELSGGRRDEEEEVEVLVIRVGRDAPRKDETRSDPAATLGETPAWGDNCGEFDLFDELDRLCPATILPTLGEVDGLDGVGVVGLDVNAGEPDRSILTVVTVLPILAGVVPIMTGPEYGMVSLALFLLGTVSLLCRTTISLFLFELWPEFCLTGVVGAAPLSLSRRCR